MYNKIARTTESDSSTLSGRLRLTLRTVRPSSGKASCGKYAHPSFSLPAGIALLTKILLFTFLELCLLKLSYDTIKYVKYAHNSPITAPEVVRSRIMPLKATEYLNGELVLTLK